MPDYSEDIALINQLKQGGKVAEQAMATIYTTYTPRLVASMRSEMGVDDAEELVQEIFLRFLEKGTLLQYRGDSSLSTWLFTCIRNDKNRLLSKIIKKRDHVDSSDDVSNLTDAQIKQDELDVIVNEMMQSDEYECRKKVWTMFIKTNQKQADALQACRAFGWKSADYANLLDKTEKNLNQFLYEATQKLQSLFLKHCAEYL